MWITRKEVPASIQRRFQETLGLDPNFRTNAGANSPNADVSTVAARRSAYSMLLTKGLIRVGIGIPADAEFELADVEDPYHHASAAELSLFRRPLPSANLNFLSTVMWDGRETFADPASSDCIQGTSECFAPLEFDLSDQSNGATLGHAQASAFDPVVFRLFDAWAAASPHANVDNATAAARRTVARGQALFNGKRIQITGVKGLNDDLGIPVLQGTCSTCHDSPGAGNHSIPAPLDIGIADGSRATPDMPLYVLRNNATHATIATTDPGRALITGKWKDVGRFKGPVLRSLASRPPYFHNGSAADLGAVVDFYNQRFSIGLTAAERDDLVAFLRSL